MKWHVAIGFCGFRRAVKYSAAAVALIHSICIQGFYFVIFNVDRRPLDCRLASMTLRPAARLFSVRAAL